MIRREKIVFDIYGHRGYPVRFPENSMASFNYTIQHGADGIETDVQQTIDGALVIMHDELIDRTTNGNGWIKDMTLAELHQYQLVNGEQVPLLADVLDLLAPTEIQLNLEFKTSKVHYPGIEAAVHQLVMAKKMAGRTVYSSFDADTLRRLHTVAPHQPLALLTTKTGEIPKFDALRPILSALHMEHYQPQIDFPQRLWTVDDPLEIRSAMGDTNVVGIITDDFERAMQIRQSRLAMRA